MSCSSSSGSEEEDEGIDSYHKGGYHAVRIGDRFSTGRYIAKRKLTILNPLDMLLQRFRKAHHNLRKLLFMRSKFFYLLLNEIRRVQNTWFNRYKELELNRVREICKCILIALDHLHRELSIIHTDLKLENILLFSTIDHAKDPIRSSLTPILERPEGEAESSQLVANEEIVTQLSSKGFNQLHCQKTAINTLNAGVKEAMNWLHSHMDDQDIDAPISHGTQGAEMAIDQSAVNTLVLFGFQEEIARMALKASVDAGLPDE